MGRACTALLAATLILACSVSAARAESAPRRHDGLHFQLQAGLGYYDASSQAQSLSGITIPTALLVGGTPIEGFAIGGGVILDYAPSPSAEQNGVEISPDFSQLLLGLGIYADYYVDADKGGLHFLGFLGWGGLEETSGTGGSDPTGLMTSFGLGYEMWIADQWSAGGMVRVSYGSFELEPLTFNTLAPALVGTLSWH